MLGEKGDTYTIFAMLFFNTKLAVSEQNSFDISSYTLLHLQGLFACGFEEHLR